MNLSAAPYLLGPQEGESRRSVDGALTSFKATGEMTGGRLVVIEDLASKGNGTPLHRHPDDEESFYILEGNLTFWLGDDSPVVAPAGAFVHIPGGIAHAFRVDSGSARYMIITTPRHGEFYRAISDPADESIGTMHAEMDMARIEAACDRFGVEILGPPPDMP